MPSAAEYKKAFLAISHGPPSAYIRTSLLDFMRSEKSETHVADLDIDDDPCGQLKASFHGYHESHPEEGTYLA
jgi:hypothetical protein